MDIEFDRMPSNRAHRYGFENIYLFFGNEITEIIQYLQANTFLDSVMLNFAEKRQFRIT